MSEIKMDTICAYRAFQDWKTALKLRQLHIALQKRLSLHLNDGFEQLLCFLQDKNVLHEMNTIHNMVKLHLNAQNVLTALMVQHHPDIILESKEDQNFHSLQMQIKARRLNQWLWLWPKPNKSQQQHHVKTTKLPFWSTYKVLALDFHESLVAWKKADQMKTLTPFFDMYHELYCLYNELDESDQKMAMVRIEKFEHDIQKLGGINAVQMMKQYHDARKQVNGEETPEQRLEIHLRQQMKQAFWHQLLETLYSNDWTTIPSLLKDLKTMLVQLSPSNTTLYEENIDLEFISGKIENNVMTASDILALIDYLANEITQLDFATRLQASINNDHSNQLWKDTIHEQFRQQMDLQLILVSFFKNAFQRLERIETLVNLLKR